MVLKRYTHCTTKRFSDSRGGGGGQQNASGILGGGGENRRNVRKGMLRADRVEIE